MNSLALIILAPMMDWNHLSFNIVKISLLPWASDFNTLRKVIPPGSAYCEKEMEEKGRKRGGLAYCQRPRMGGVQSAMTGTRAEGLLGKNVKKPKTED